MSTHTKGMMAVVATLLLGACAQQPVVEAPFGDAVRHMTEHQTYNLDASYNPDPSPVMGGDGDRLNAVLESHRKAVADPVAAGGTPLTGVSGRKR